MLFDDMNAVCIYIIEQRHCGDGGFGDSSYSCIRYLDVPGCLGNYTKFMDLDLWRPDLLVCWIPSVGCFWHAADTPPLEGFLILRCAIHDPLEGLQI